MSRYFCKPGLALFAAFAVGLSIGSAVAAEAGTIVPGAFRANPFGAVSASAAPAKGMPQPVRATANPRRAGQALAWNKLTRFEFVNGTGGSKSDSQVYWAIVGRDWKTGKFVHVDLDGKLVPMELKDNKVPKNGKLYADYFHTMAEAKSVTLPPINSARILFSVGEPMYIQVNKDVNGDLAYAGANIENPNDPNQQVIFDFVEMAIVPEQGIYINTTRVDHFGFPIRLRLQGMNGYDEEVGETESREALFSKFESDLPVEFRSLVKRPYRIIAPAHGEFDHGGAYANYLGRYIDAVWDRYSREDLVFSNSRNMQFKGRVENGEFVFHDASGAPNDNVYRVKRKPTTAEAMLGNGVLDDASGAHSDIERQNQLHIQAQLCAAINRHVAETPEKWSDHSAYYPAGEASNHYASFWHDHGIRRLSYGFAYDDVFDASASLHTEAPTEATITIGW